MQRGLTGRYEMTQVGAETIRAFIPHPQLPVVSPLPEPVEGSGPNRKESGYGG